MTGKSKGSEQYWLWVTRKESYLKDGKDSPHLEPGYESNPGDWWTCCKDTRYGDYFFLYRTSPKMDIAYLIQATSDAYDISNHKYGGDGWNYGCDYRVLEKLTDPITIQDLREDKVMKDWSLLKAQFRIKCSSISPDDWDHLIRLAKEKNPGFKGI